MKTRCRVCKCITWNRLLCDSCVKDRVVPLKEKPSLRQVLDELEKLYAHDPQPFSSLVDKYCTYISMTDSNKESVQKICVYRDETILFRLSSGLYPIGEAVHIVDRATEIFNTLRITDLSDYKNFRSLFNARFCDSWAEDDNMYYRNDREIMANLNWYLGVYE